MIVVVLREPDPNRQSRLMGTAEPAVVAVVLHLLTERLT
jgi:hypothetical protein